MGYMFNIQKDHAVIDAGGFWCKACCVGRPAAEQSPDLRYCQGCYDILKREAETLVAAGDSHRPGWIPVGAVLAPVLKCRYNTEAKKQTVSKLPAEEKIQGTISELPDKENSKALKHAGGRPRKVGGGLSRSTLWRRRKEARKEVQGVDVKAMALPGD